MSTPSSAKRRQPERGAKSQAARQHMNTQKQKNGMLGATPSSYYLAIAQRNADKSGLLRLPPEIRQRIWTYAVHVQTVIVGYGTYPEDARYYPEQSILRVCRQVHAETCLLPYSGNTFSPDDMGCFNVWLKRRLPEQLAALRRLELWCHEYPKSPLRLLSGLKHVRVYCICDGLCPLDPGRGKAIKENLEGIWGNSDLEIQIAHG